MRQTPVAWIECLDRPIHRLKKLISEPDSCANPLDESGDGQGIQEEEKLGDRFMPGPDLKREEKVQLAPSGESIGMTMEFKECEDAYHLDSVGRAPVLAAVKPGGLENLPGRKRQNSE